tara:strand:- start:3964 stop:4983 length:1020 start_codon:yes stop_codon:yes gene_type:complete
MPKKSQQINIHGPNLLSLDSIDYPLLGSNDLIIEIKCCGICGTDLGYLLSGGLMGPQDKPMPLGHEMSGSVIEIGSSIKNIYINDRVAINPVENNNHIGNGGQEGGMTNFLLVKNATLNKNIFKLPDDMSFEVGALIEPFAVALRAIHRSKLNQDSKVSVLGLGCIGFSVVTLLSYLGYKNTVAIDLSELRVSNTNNLDSVHAFNDWSLFVNALKEFHGADEVFGMTVSDTDAFIDCTGNHTILSKIVDISKTHARIIIAGLHKEEALVNFRSVLMRELEITTSMAYSREEFQQSLEILSNNVIDQDKFISHKCSIQDYKKAFDLAKNGNIATKVMLEI